MAVTSVVLLVASLSSASLLASCSVNVAISSDRELHLSVNSLIASVSVWAVDSSPMRSWRA